MSVYYVSNLTDATGICSLSLHDALPISRMARKSLTLVSVGPVTTRSPSAANTGYMSFRDSAPAKSKPAHCRGTTRSEEHTSELQSRIHLVCRLLLVKKNIIKDVRKETAT